MGYIESFEDIMQMETKMLRFSIEYLKEHYENELGLLRVKLPVIGDILAIPLKNVLSTQWKAGIIPR